VADHITILVVDDHPLVREGLRSILDNFEDFSVTGTARTGELAISMYSGLKPDVVLMDVNLPDMTGMDALTRIRQTAPDARVLLLTSFIEGADVQMALDMGATGFLSKNAEVSELARAVRAAHEGKHTLSPEAVKSLIQNRPKLTPTGQLLTEREMSVLTLLARGMTNQDIGRELSISVSTVKAYAAKIYRKLGVNTRAEAIAKSVNLQLISLP
jgi:DNA-binding NarL/FixJ family response regulator